MVALKNRRKKPSIKDKENATLEELKKIKSSIISAGRKPTDEEEREIEELRNRLNNFTEIKKVWLTDKEKQNYH